MKKHFVVFESPGTLFHETTEREIDSWNIEKAGEMAHEIVERHSASPFAFHFITRIRGEGDLDSHVSGTSPRYFLGGIILTAGDIEKRTDRDYSTLLSNMRCNKWHNIVENRNSWLVFQPLMPGDVVLDWKPKAKKEAA